MIRKTDTNAKPQELSEIKDGKITFVKQNSQPLSSPRGEVWDKPKTSLRNSEILKTEPDVILKENKKNSQELYYKVSVYRSPGRTRGGNSQPNNLPQKSPKGNVLQKSDVPSYTYSLSELIQGAQIPFKKKEVR